MSKALPAVALILATFIVTPIHAEEKAEDQTPVINCWEYYEKTKVCPKQVCDFGCLGGVYFKDCEMTCEPKPCFEIEPGQCPTDRCQLLVGCEAKAVCYPLNDFQPSCGDLAYAGSDAPCCRSMIKRCGVEFFDGTCDMAARYSMFSVPICLPCGNGVCNQFENACNCPEDCGKGYKKNKTYTGFDADRYAEEERQRREAEGN